MKLKMDGVCNDTCGKDQNSTTLNTQRHVKRQRMGRMPRGRASRVRSKSEWAARSGGNTVAAV